MPTKDFTFGYCKKGQTPAGCGTSSPRQLVALRFQKTGKVSARLCRQCCKKYRFDWPKKEARS